MEQIKVIFEDNHLLAVNKPAGMLVQADETGDRTLEDWAKDYIKSRYNKPGDVFLGVIHRLDRPVSGVIIFARTSKALERMNKLMAERQIDKYYWAVVNERPHPEVGHLTHYIARDYARHMAKVYDQPSNRSGDAKIAELDYELLSSIGDQHLMGVRLLTGRHHQIRAQFARIGSPIRGDKKYGFPTANRDGCIQLHCRSMSFVHPVTKVQTHIDALPDTKNDDIWRLFKHLL